MAGERKVYVRKVSPVGLIAVGQRPSLGDYTRQLWARRHFTLAESRAKAGSKNRSMLLGKVWMILRPILDTTAYLVIFGWLLRTDRGIENFIGYLIIGVFMFRFTTRCLNSGSLAITRGRNMLRSFVFPRAALPISVVLREVFAMIPILITMLVLIAIIPPHPQYSWRYLLFPFIFGLQVIFCFGLALVSARLVAKVPDLTHGIAFLSRFWLYGSAVFFAPTRFVSHPTVLKIMEINPMFLVLDMSRDVLLYAQTPDLSSWLKLSAWAFGLAIFGFIFFWKAEETYGNL